MKIWLLLLTSALLASPRTYQGHFLNPSRLYGSVDFLWWQGSEKGLEFASHFEPAFRFSLGYHLPSDAWNAEFTYTRFYTHTTDHIHSSGWTQAPWKNATSAWQLHTNFFELFLKHPFSLSTELMIEPALSLKYALLQQRYQLDYTNGKGTSTLTMKNNSFNLGPAASLLSRWYFADPFHLFANLSGALFGSYFHVERNASETGDFWTLRPQAGASLGLGFSDSICRPKQVLYYAFSASYETQIYWKQNMLYRLTDNPSAAQGSLFFHGLTFTAMIDF